MYCSTETQVAVLTTPGWTFLTRLACGFEPCVLRLGNMIESALNALLLKSPPSHSDVLWSTSSAETQTWLTQCAAQAAAPGPNPTSSTWQPFKCPVRSSCAMTLILTHHTQHTHWPLRIQTMRPGPVISLDFGIFKCNLRRAAKITRNRSITQMMRRQRREARMHRVPGKHCRESGQYSSDLPNGTWS